MAFSMALLTDLYQLTMAYGYWKLGIHEREAAFHLIFRKHPFQGNYAVSCGLASVIEFLRDWHFSADDLEYLARLKTTENSRLFPDDFLAYLKTLRFTCDLDAIPEGQLIFPHEPLLRIQGPLIQGQLLESTLLNLINFQTLIATKASRVCQAALTDTVVEFGLRRAQGPDGALSASRAAYVGGCSATSNVLAGKLFDVPVIGTHAHSWVTVFSDEMTAFSEYANVMPDNCVLLVDTYNTLQGIDHAIAVGKTLRARGKTLRGIRLDSGDLATLSIQARVKLDAAGFHDTQIIASNTLDEYVITHLKDLDAQIAVWGVGTNLVTAYDHPALDGVYKLTALQNTQGEWEYKLKISDDPVKISNPGIHQVRRYFENGHFKMDVVYDTRFGIDPTPTVCIIEPAQPAKKLTHYDEHIDLLQPIFRRGQLTYSPPSIHATRELAFKQTQQFLKSFPHQVYPIALENQLFECKTKLVGKILDSMK